MVRFFDNKKQYKSLKNKLEPKILELLRSGKYISGEEVEKFEHNLADYCNTKHAICVNSGTTALQLAIESLDLIGVDILVPSLTFYATIEAIYRSGNSPIYIDIDPDTYCIDIKQIREYLESNNAISFVGAILPVHLYGQCANMSEIRKIAKEYDLFVIEDACQSIGATHYGEKAGSMGDLGCFSFYPSKNLGAFGEGGAIITNNDTLAQKCRALRNHGQNAKYVHQYIGLNGRMSEIQALVLNHKLLHLDSYIEKRQKIAKTYDIELNKYVKIPQTVKGNTHTYHLYVVRGDIKQKLKNNNIGYGVHYPIPCHQSDNIKKDLKVTNKIIKEIISLPIYPELTNKEVLETCEVIKNEM